MRKPAPLGKLFRRRRCIVPTFRGALLLLLFLAAIVTILVRWSFNFFAVTKPVPGGVLVVEGWAPDHVIVEAVAEFRRKPYAKLLVTGGPIDKGALFSEHRTYAELGAATIRRLDQSLPVEAVPAPFARRDRTYASVLALKQWSAERDVPLPTINVVSLGVHSRRTWTLYRKVLGKNAEIGIIAVPEQTFDPQAWWRSSAGVRTVVGEMIAYGYVRLLFFAEE